MGDVLTVHTAGLQGLRDDDQWPTVRSTLIAGANPDVLSTLLLPPRSLGAPPALLPGCLVLAQPPGAPRRAVGEAAAVVAAVWAPGVSLLAGGARAPVHPAALQHLGRSPQICTVTNFGNFFLNFTLLCYFRCF